MRFRGGNVTSTHQRRQATQHVPINGPGCHRPVDSESFKNNSSSIPTGTSSHLLYKNWIREELIYKTIACFIWYIAGLCTIVHLLQISLTGRVINWIYTFFSFRTFAYTLLFATSHVLLLLARLPIRKVHDLVLPHWQAVLWYCTSPFHILLLILYPMSALVSTWSYIQFSQWDFPIVTVWPFCSVQCHRFSFNEASFAVGGIIIFSICFALTSFARNESTLRFPILRCGRLIQFKSRLWFMISEAGENAICFTTVWYILHFSLFASGGLVWSFISWTNNTFQPQDNIWVGISLVSKLFSLLFTCHLSWQLGRNLLEIFMTENINFNKYLLEGLCDTNTYRKYLAFQFLNDVCEFSANHRRCMYDLQEYYSPVETNKVETKYDPYLRETIKSDSSSAWNVILSCCLTQLNDLTKALSKKKKRGYFALSPEQKTRELFKDNYLAISSAQSISILCAFSLEEDDNGVVQRRLSEIISALLGCSLAIEEYCDNTDFISIKQKKALCGAPMFRPAPLILANHLDNALYRIVGTYYDDLPTWHLEPKYASRLKLYVSCSK